MPITDQEKTRIILEYQELKSIRAVAKKCSRSCYTVNKILFPIKKERYKERDKQNYQKNKEKFRASALKYYHEHKEKCNERAKQWRASHKQKVKDSNHEYYINNKEKIKECVKQNKTKNIARYRKNWRLRYHNDINFRLLDNLRSSINNKLRKYNTKKTTRTLNLLGCSIEDLKKHLESQFKPGMSWQNRNEWHIDHIRPCSSFDLTKVEEQNTCWNYTNLQPLWAAENLHKSNKIDYVIDK